MGRLNLTADLPIARKFLQYTNWGEMVGKTNKMSTVNPRGVALNRY